PSTSAPGATVTFHGRFDILSVSSIRNDGGGGLIEDTTTAILTLLHLQAAPKAHFLLLPSVETSWYDIVAPVIAAVPPPAVGDSLQLSMAAAESETGRVNQDMAEHQTSAPHQLLAFLSQRRGAADLDVRRRWSERAREIWSGHKGKQGRKLDPIADLRIKRTAAVDRSLHRAVHREDQGVGRSPGFVAIAGRGDREADREVDDEVWDLICLLSSWKAISVVHPLQNRMTGCTLMGSGKSTSCIAFILEMYKEAGLFDPISCSIQVTEFKIKDAYSLNFFDTDASRLPSWCNDGDDVKLP
ncbi:hypothetical protein LINPERHAP1_LOCUS663, partial [Linum perenne]